MGERIVGLGTTDLRISKNSRSMRRIKKLCRIYRPYAIVIEDVKGTESNRCLRVKDLITLIKEFTESENIKCVFYTPEQVREVFSNFGAKTKHERALKIINWLPELKYSLPEKRTFFRPESLQYGVFDAAALALTYFYLQE